MARPENTSFFQKNYHQFITTKSSTTWSIPSERGTARPRHIQPCLGMRAFMPNAKSIIKEPKLNATLEALDTQKSEWLPQLILHHFRNRDKHLSYENFTPNTRENFSAHICHMKTLLTLLISPKCITTLSRVKKRTTGHSTLSYLFINKHQEHKVLFTMYVQEEEVTKKQNLTCNICCIILNEQRQF